MDLLCFSVLCLLCFCMRLFICALWSPAGKGLTSWLSFVVSSCELTLSHQVWYFIVSIADLCTLTYFKHYSVVLIILIIIIAPRQLGNHPMQLQLHNSAFKN